MSLKSSFTQNLYNIPGWRTKRHIVVIESDDWGSVRMPSKDSYEQLLKAGIRVDKCHYCMNDSLASEDDLSSLFDVLHSVKDKNGNSAILTANAVVANPDFEKIKANGFNEYYYETIDKTFSRFNDCQNALQLWKQGADSGCFHIQSHGREHLNVARWMHYLQQGLPETMKAFDLHVYGISTNITSEKRKSFLPAFDFSTADEEASVNAVAVDGLSLFEKLFGYRSTSFIAPNYTWGKSLEKTLASQGVMYLQGQHAAVYKSCKVEDRKKRVRYFGKTNEYGQVDLVRNAVFEPSEFPSRDWVNACVSEIANAFFWHHPAVICSHRVNFVGRINPTNRDSGLRQLKQLLFEIKRRWPDVEFMSSDQLGDLICKK